MPRKNTGIKIDRFFDIETENWDTYVLGGVVDSGTERYQEFRNGDDLFENLLSTGGDVWSWNGGLFDILWFSDVARRNGIPCTVHTAGTRITRLDCGRLSLRDAVALCPMSLAKAAQIAGVDVVKNTSLPCDCGEDCGGYCAIKTDMPESHYLSLSRYLRGDCVSGLRIVEALIDESNSQGISLRGTVGGSSWASCKRKLGLKGEKWKRGHYEFARAAYFGGRTEVFRPESARGHAYDINSAYPAALSRLALPIGPRQEFSNKRAREAFDSNRVGIYAARALVKEDTHVPPLPFRFPSGRVSFPIGEMVGIWTGLELSYAQSLGVELEIHGALVWTEAQPIVADYVQEVWDRRAFWKRRGNTSLERWYKWLANSLTGKFAENPDKDSVHLLPGKDEIKACPGGNCKGRCSEKKCCDHQCVRKCGAWRPISPQGDIWTAPIWRLSDCAHVHWAAYLTAFARIELHSQLIDDGKGGKTAVYCDTDSCYSETPRGRIGEGLGEWGSEGEYRDFLALAPKCYRYTREDDSVALRAKGLSGITPEAFEAFAAGKPVRNSRGVMGFRSAARAGGRLFRRKDLERRSHNDGVHYGGRVLTSHGWTVPQTIQEIEAWEKHK